MIPVKAKNIDEYITAFPPDVQQMLEQVRTTIKAAHPGLEEAISYAMPTFKFRKKNLVHFAAYKNHIGFYATPTGHEAFKKDLSVYKSGKGSVQFPLDKPMPLDLIRRIVEFRIQNTLEKANGEKKRKK